LKLYLQIYLKTSKSFLDSSTSQGTRRDAAEFSFAVLRTFLWLPRASLLSGIILTISCLVIVQLQWHKNIHAIHANFRGQFLCSN
jgi:hypothetical protein